MDSRSANGAARTMQQGCTGALPPQLPSKAPAPPVLGLAVSNLPPSSSFPTISQPSCNGGRSPRFPRRPPLWVAERPQLPDCLEGALPRVRLQGLHGSFGGPVPLHQDQQGRSLSV